MQPAGTYAPSMVLPPEYRPEAIRPMAIPPRTTSGTVVTTKQAKATPVQTEASGAYWVGMPIPRSTATMPTVSGTIANNAGLRNSIREVASY